MTIQFKFGEGQNIGTKFRAVIDKFSERRIKAIQRTAYRAAADIETEGRANMKKGGNFGSPRWQEGLHAKVSYTSRQDLNIRTTHDVPYWGVFEFGATIHGKPLLWIPLSFASDAQGVRARDYPAPLFRVDRQGKAPLLLSDTGPKYFGKEQVTIPKKWTLRQVVRDVSRRMSQYFKQEMRNGR